MGVTGGVVPFWNWWKPHAECEGRYSFTPPGLCDFPFLPTACAVGCLLAPLCGWRRSQIGVRRNPSAAKAGGFGCSCGMAEAMPSQGQIIALRRSELPRQIVKDLHYPIDNVFVHMLSGQCLEANYKIAQYEVCW